MTKWPYNRRNYARWSYCRHLFSRQFKKTVVFSLLIDEIFLLLEGYDDRSTVPDIEKAKVSGCTARYLLF
ncbi:MAG TPA: hypothetical protein VGN00_13705 [Puia sp.]